LINYSDINRRHIDAQEDYFQLEFTISKEQGDLSTAYSAIISSGKLNCIYGDLEKAEKYYLDALDVAKRIGSADLINHAKAAIGIVRGSKDPRPQNVSLRRSDLYREEDMTSIINILLISILRTSRFQRTE
jgi:hypothetical protein